MTDDEIQTTMNDQPDEQPDVDDTDDTKPGEPTAAELEWEKNHPRTQSADIQAPAASGGAGGTAPGS